MSETSVMDPGDSERERLLHQVAHLGRELAQAQERAREMERQRGQVLERLAMDREAVRQERAVETRHFAAVVERMKRAEGALNEACGWAMWAGMVEGGVEAEREACARELDALAAEEVERGDDPVYPTAWVAAFEIAAERIRARGKAGGA